MNYQDAKITATHNFHSFRRPAVMGIDYRREDRAAVVRVRQEPYPATMAENIDDEMKFRRGLVPLVKQFAADKPWRGDDRERFDKLAGLHVALCELYGIFPALVARDLTGGCSGGSSFSPVGNVITMRGKLSVLTYLHEFGHALGKGEKGTARWSLNLFKRCFPRAFARLRAEGHTLRTPSKYAA